MFHLPTYQPSVYKPEDVIWEWNGEDVSQFDLTTLMNGQTSGSFTGSISMSVHPGAYGRNELEISGALRGYSIFRISNLDMSQHDRYQIVINVLSGNFDTIGIDGDDARLAVPFFMYGSFTNELVGESFVTSYSEQNGMIYLKGDAGSTTNSAMALPISSSTGSNDDGHKLGNYTLDDPTHQRGGMKLILNIDHRANPDYAVSVIEIDPGVDSMWFGGITSYSASYSSWQTEVIDQAESFDTCGIGLMTWHADVQSFRYYIRDFVILKHPLDRIT